MKYEPLTLAVLFALCLSIQMIYFLKEENSPVGPAKLKFKKYWHWAGGAIHIWGAYTIYRLAGWQYGLFTGSLTWYVFDGAINTYAFNREWWYIGTTALIDQVQQWIGKLFRTDPRLISAILKNVLLLFSLYLLIKTLL